MPACGHPVSCRQDALAEEKEAEVPPQLACKRRIDTAGVGGSCWTSCVTSGRVRAVLGLQGPDSEQV